MNRYVLAIVESHKRYPLPVGLLILVIGISLSLSAVHNHDMQNYSYDSQQAVEHTISKDSTTCPICGYLFHADYVAKVTAENGIRFGYIIRNTPEFYRDKSLAASNQKRGPPHFA